MKTINVALAVAIRYFGWDEDILTWPAWQGSTVLSQPMPYENTREFLMGQALKNAILDQNNSRCEMHLKEFWKVDAGTEARACPPGTAW